MSIQCPACKHKLRPMSIREGRFEPRCPKCGEAFVMRLQVMSADAYRAYKSQRRAGRRALEKLKSLDADKTTSDRNVAIAERPAEVPSKEFAQSEVFVELATHQPGDLPSQIANDSAPPNSLERLGGYKVLKMLGHGGMGEVYLAKQLSLNRSVAIKTICAQYSNNAAMLSRFTREAYAAAQLTHHNIVQVYDLSESNGIHFFSMEYVEGTPLDRLIQQRKALDPRTAVSYTLQAAKGLLFAHEHGMVHRDVKPANLLLNQHGIIKVADLGLVKTKDTAEVVSSAENPSIRSALDSQSTMAGESMGSPAFMAPEQCVDAATVDHRADIYSLGCTLYMFLTGRPPFEGRTPEEVMKKHRTASVERPDQIVPSIPPELSSLTLKMLAKNKEDRPSGLSDVIVQLEEQLQQGGSPNARFANGLLGWMNNYRASKLGNLRPRLILGLYSIAALMAVFLLAQFNFVGFLSVVGIATLATVTHTIITGIVDRTYLFEQLRQLVFASSWSDYGIWLLVACAFVGTIAISQAYLLAAVVIIGGLGVSAGVYFGLDQMVAKQRSAAVKGALGLVRQMRLEGMDESTIQRLAAEGCGEKWEEFFEELFGYRAKRDIRKWIETERSGMRSVKHAAWRDKLIDSIQSRLDEIAQARCRAKMKKVELARLKAEGKSPSEARQMAAEEADRMVDHTAALRASAREYAMANKDRRDNLKQMIRLARAGTGRNRNSLVTRLKSIPKLLFGSRLRFALGAALLILGLAWLQHNHVFDAINQSVSQTESISDLTKVDLKKIAGQIATDARITQYESLPYLPSFVAAMLGCIGTSIAGLLLIVTAPCGGMKGTLFAFLSGIISILGPGFLMDYLPDFSLPIPLLSTSEVIAFALAICTAGLAWWLND